MQGNNTDNERVNNMSMRQQILYILQMSQHTTTEWDNKGTLFTLTLLYLLAS